MIYQHRHWSRVARGESACPAFQHHSVAFAHCRILDGVRREASVLSEFVDDAEHVEQPAKTAPRKRKTAPSTAAAKGKGRAKTPPLSKNFVSTVEWPEHFKKLQRTFQALNTVYTFLSARKHLASTFDNLKSSVQAIIKRCERVSTPDR